MRSERRALTLKIAASMLRRQSGKEMPPSPESLVRYAAVLDNYLYHSVVPEDTVDTFYDPRRSPDES